MRRGSDGTAYSRYGHRVSGTIPAGFQVGGFDLSGMTREEAGSED